VGAGRWSVTVPFAVLVVVACNFPTHHGGGGGGGDCQSMTLLNEDFSSGTLGNWFTRAGAPVVSTTVGESPPSAQLSNAFLQSAIKFQTSANCGLRISGAIRIDTAFAVFKVVVPNVTRVAQINATDSAVQYILCQASGCNSQHESYIADDNFHLYEYDEVTDSAIQRWSRDGVVVLQIGGRSDTHDSLRVNLIALPADSAGIGPSRSYFDNITVIARP